MQIRRPSSTGFIATFRVLVCFLVFWFAGHAHAQLQYGHGISRIPQPDIWIAQNSDRDDFKSKSEVVREVKQRYDARVLKISLNEKRGVYRVRILMPDGKVRNISVNALR